MGQHSPGKRWDHRTHGTGPHGPSDDDVATRPRARSYARVTLSSNFLGRRNKRVTREEMKARFREAEARYARGPLRDDQLEVLSNDYARLTGLRLPRRARGLMAVVARIHDADAVPLLADLYEAMGTHENLLFEALVHPNREVVAGDIEGSTRDHPPNAAHPTTEALGFHVQDRLSIAEADRVGDS